jgi:4-amino-4-deoxy-L-arabinose transferase-like glycosyltransferase
MARAGVEPSSPGWSRWLAGAFVASALAIRLLVWARAGIDHFDEGVYAFSADGLARGLGCDGLFEGEERFSPPLYFGLGALLKWISGCAADRALIALGVAAGTATVALLWHVGRRWLGAGAGLVAAGLLAASPFHVALSAAALTDATFALLQLGAVFVLAEALERRSARLAVLGGAVTGLAWNTKYHGWFALVSTGLALLPSLWSERRGGARAIASRLLPWLAAAAVAGACYAPWALYVESRPGGYAALAEYQQTMLRTQWLDNLARHVQQQRFFDGWWGAFALPALALVGACTLLRRLRDVRAAALIAWLALWTATTPLYQPYARLYLPLAIGLMLAAGAGVDWIAARLARADRRRAVALALLIAASLALSVASSLGAPSRPWRGSRGADDAAHALAARIEPGARVLVLGEPSVAFYLHELGYRSRERVEAKALVETLSAATERTYVVAGIYARRNAQAPEQRALELLAPRLASLATVPLDVRDLRLLDDFRPRAAESFLRAPTDEYALRLYRFDP